MHTGFNHQLVYWLETITNFIIQQQMSVNHELLSEERDQLQANQNEQNAA